MISRRDPHLEEGFTLIEVLITLLVMSVLSTVILNAVTTLSSATATHRSLANVDAALTNYAEAIKKHVNFGTTLSAPITSASATTINVASASEFSAPVEIVIDGELMKVTSISGTQLTVIRGDRTTAATTHSLGATVSPVYSGCPVAANLTPVNYTSPIAHLAAGYPKITRIDYWVPTDAAFDTRGSGSSPTSNSNAGTCTYYFANQFPCTGYTDSGSPAFIDSNQPECDPGFWRVWIEAKGDSVNNNSDTTTAVLVRRGTA